MSGPLNSLPGTSLVRDITKIYKTEAVYCYLCFEKKKINNKFVFSIEKFRIIHRLKK